MNNKGIEVNENYGSLKSYHNNILEKTDALLPNLSKINKNTFNISINNKNIKFIKKILYKKIWKTDNKYHLEAEDDRSF